MTVQNYPRPADTRGPRTQPAPSPIRHCDVTAVVHRPPVRPAKSRADIKNVDNGDSPFLTCRLMPPDEPHDDPHVATAALQASTSPPGTAPPDIPRTVPAVLDHPQASKPSEHTMKANRRDFLAIANFVAGGIPINSPQLT